MRFQFAKDFLFKLQPFRRCFDYQIRICDFF